MTTDCHAESFLFQALGQREVVARFRGGTIAERSRLETRDKKLETRPRRSGEGTPTG